SNGFGGRSLLSRFREDGNHPLRREAGEREGPNRDSDWEGEVVHGTDTHLTRSPRSHPLPPKMGGEGLLICLVRMYVVERRLSAASAAARARRATPPSQDSAARAPRSSASARGSGRSRRFRAIWPRARGTARRRRRFPRSSPAHPGSSSGNSSSGSRLPMV